MRTTITLAADVAAAVDQLRTERQAGVSDVVNDLVRRGLARIDPPPFFRQSVSDLGAPLLAVDDVAGLLDALDGPTAR